MIHGVKITEASNDTYIAPSVKVCLVQVSTFPGKLCGDLHNDLTEVSWVILVKP